LELKLEFVGFCNSLIISLNRTRLELKLAGDERKPERGCCLNRTRLELKRILKNLGYEYFYRALIVPDWN